MPITRYDVENETASQKNLDTDVPTPLEWQEGVAEEHGGFVGGFGRTEASMRDNDKDTRRRTPSPKETRRELIERIKREQKPTLFRDTEAVHNNGQHTVVHELRDQGDEPDSNPILLPPLDLSADNAVLTRPRERLSPPPSPIERPKSALHSGDFRPSASTHRNNAEKPPDSPMPFRQTRQPFWPSTSPPLRWQDQTTHVLAQNLLMRANEPRQTTEDEFDSFQARSRAASISSLSSSFIFRPPTSPLAHQSNSNDFDDDHSLRRPRSRSPHKGSRRRTFSPRSLGTFEKPPVTSRREITFPYQAHQPRRSIGSLSTSQSFSVPHTPSAVKRRPSQGSDASPLQRAPMVGRYEESILRGRMSTLPSKPFDFVAKIGVLGKGRCKSSLRCPPHVSIPFPAVFYDYGSQRGKPGFSPDGPSPYVGMVDLENSPRDVAGPPTHENDNPNSFGTNPGSDNQSIDSDALVEPMEDSLLVRRARQVPKPDTDTQPSKTPRGAYRIPQQGQIQVIIKNPNNTAVKLFLVPYDLSDMEPGQKTFIRQRSYSAGPIIEMSTNPRRDNSSDSSGVHTDISEDANDRPVLRYLIHLHICCPSKGRYYLYKSIRVVFANRVPDGKEKLRNEIQLPEPRYSTFKYEPAQSPRPGKFADFSPPGMPGRSNPTLESLAKENSPFRISNQFAANLPLDDPFDFPKAPMPSTGLSRITSTDSRSDVGSPMSLDGPDSLTSPTTTHTTWRYRCGPDDSTRNGKIFQIGCASQDEPPRSAYNKGSTAPPPHGAGLLALQLRKLENREEQIAKDPST